MRLRSLLRGAAVGSLIGLVAGGCGSSTLAPQDAGPSEAGPPDSGGPGDTPVSETGDGPGSTAAQWIYVATATGVQRIAATGGDFQPFGMAAATQSVAVSPGGALVAQELIDQRVAVFDATGAARAMFDVRPGLLGWSDDTTLLFLDPQTKFLQQTSVDGQTRRYLLLPSGLNAYGYSSATLSPDRSLLVTLALPLARDNVVGYYVHVLSAVDGSVVRDLGVSNGIVVWTGDGRLFMTAPSGQGFVVVSPRSGTSAPVPTSAALTAACSYGSWYESGRIRLGAPYTPTGSDVAMCRPSALLDVDSGNTSDPGVSTTSSDRTMFVQSADARDVAVATGSTLELAAVAGGTPRALGVASGTIIGVSWAPASGASANLVAPPKPPQTATGLAGAPSVDTRSGGADCRTGRWVNRTPDPVPAGWPAPRMNFSSTFDTDRGALIVEGGLAGNLGTLPNLDYETMEWNGATGQWTNRSRPDGFGPVFDRPMAYDPNRKVVLALSPSLYYDGTWGWTPDGGWKNLRPQGDLLMQPWEGERAASVYDVARDRWLVVGIEAGSEWDGSTWQFARAVKPQSLASQTLGARLVYDSKRAQVYLLPGDTGTAPWLYEPAQNRWTEQPSAAPSPLPRRWAAVAYDARRDRVMVYGGLVPSGGSGNVVGDLAEWDPATGAWRSCPATGAAPPARTNAAFAYDAKRDVLVMFGGMSADSSSPIADTWEWYVP